MKEPVLHKIRAKTDYEEKLEKYIKHMKTDAKLTDKNPMRKLTKDQKEYFQLKQASENTWATMIRLEEEGKLPSCTVHPLQDDYGTGTRFMFEVYSYTLMEIYEGKHNDFLQLIIDKDK